MLFTCIYMCFKCRPILCCAYKHANVGLYKASLYMYKSMHTYLYKPISIYFRLIINKARNLSAKF